MSESTSVIYYRPLLRYIWQFVRRFSVHFRLGKSSDDVQFQERERTKRIVYSVIYGVGKEDNSVFS